MSLTVAYCLQASMSGSPPAGLGSKLLSPSYFKQRMLVPPSGFQQPGNTQGSDSVTIRDGDASLPVRASSMQLEDRHGDDKPQSLPKENEPVAPQVEAQLPMIIHHGKLQTNTSGDGGQTKSRSRQVVESKTAGSSLEKMSSHGERPSHGNTRSKSTQSRSPNTEQADEKSSQNSPKPLTAAGVHRRSKEMSPTEVKRKRVMTSKTSNGHKRTGKPTTKEMTSTRSTGSPTNTQLDLVKSSKRERETSSEAATHSLQFDNYYKYAAGRCAIATTKERWEYDDTEHETELGETSFHRSLMSKLERADKHLKYFNSAADTPTTGTGRQHPPTLTAPTDHDTVKRSSDSKKARDLQGVRSSAVQGPSLEIVASKPSFSNQNSQLNDLSVDDPPTSDSGSLNPEDIPNTHEIQLLSSQAAGGRKTSSRRQTHSHQSSDRLSDLSAGRRSATNDLDVTAMASGVQVDTQSDLILAQILQSEEDSRHSCAAASGYGPTERGRPSDFELARQLQQELDQEVAVQLQYQEQQQHHHGAYRTHESHYHHSGHSYHHGDTRSASSAHFDNNGRYQQRPRDRYNEQEHPHRDHTHYTHGQMVGSVAAVHPLYYPGHHGNRLHPHFVETQDEVDMSYEALSELEDVSRGLDKSTVQRLTNLHEYVPQESASATGSVEKSCSICLSEFEGGQMLRSLPCFHSFHEQCIDRWLETNKQCPVCLIELEPNNR